MVSRFATRKQSGVLALAGLVVFVVLIFRVSEVTAQEIGDEQQRQITFYMDLGLLKYGRIDASGSRELLILTRDGTGTFTHQHLTVADGTDFHEILKARGLLREMPNRETGRREKHLMVFNPKDRHTFVWVPVSQLHDVHQRIISTGKTLATEAPPQRRTEHDLSLFTFPDSF